ncbi:MAG TPA: hypothetical protein VG734_11580 [Lacunisphaera sp.]|nr:hypothetical protein [Lacunisphaera sp.]
MVAVAQLLTGCVSSKYQAASALGAQPAWMKINLGSQPLKTQLDAVIVYHGPGSWKKSAYWDEYLVTFSNESSVPVTLTAVNLVDYFGTLMSPANDPWKLEKASQLQRDRYRRVGVNFALNTLGYVALTYGAVGTGVIVGAAATNSWAGVTTGAAVGVAAVPVTAIVVYVNNQNHRRAIEAEFHRRRLTLPLSLGPGETRSGSLFFAMAVSPQSFRLESTGNGSSEFNSLPLPMLAGMHRKEAPTVVPPSGKTFAPVVPSLP